MILMASANLRFSAETIFSSFSWFSIAGNAPDFRCRTLYFSKEQDKVEFYDSK